MRALHHVFSCLLAGALGSLLACLAMQFAFGAGLILPSGLAGASLCLDWAVPRMVVWSLWGLLFLLPVLSRRPVCKGLLLSLVPSIFMLLEAALLAGGNGLLMLGYTIPVVLAFNVIWALCATGWLALDRHRWS